MTGTLFAIVLSMIAQALVTGSRTQAQLSHKIAVHRQASMALDMLVRDAEMARYAANLRLIEGAANNPVPDVFTKVQNSPIPPVELWISRVEAGTTLYDAPLPKRRRQHATSPAIRPDRNSRFGRDTTRRKNIGPGCS